MSEYVDGKSLRKLMLGLKVDHAAEAVAAALTPIFTVAGGRILMTGFLGEMTVVSGANAVHFEATPTTGASIPLAAALDIDAMVVGDILTITGLGTDAALYNASTAGIPMMYRPMLIPIGSISYHAAAAEGTMKWTMFYIPIDDGAYVRAA